MKLANLKRACFRGMISQKGAMQMELARKHRQVLETLKEGAIWTELSVEQQEAVRYLEGLGLARARVDIKDDLWMLTEKGEAVWDDLQARDEQAKKEADEHAKEKAEQRKEKRSERRFRILEGFLAGAVFTNMDRIIAFLVEWLPRIWRAIWK